MHVSLFLASILEGTSSHHSVRIHVYTLYVYSIDWSHKAAGLEPPSSHHVVRFIFAASQRICGKPTMKKEPITAIDLRSMVENYCKTKTYINADQLRCVCWFFEI